MLCNYVREFVVVDSRGDWLHEYICRVVAEGLNSTRSLPDLAEMINLPLVVSYEVEVVFRLASDYS